MAAPQSCPATAACSALPAAHGPVPSARQLAWHGREVYGFVHFTVNTFTGKEWGYGDEPESVFAPSALDCRQWVAAAKAGGLGALILTAKHHDGFCLWPTATTTHNIARSPFRGGKGDVVGELAEACREGGIGFGIYCSPWDRNHAEYGRDGYVAAYHAQFEELLTRYGELCEVWFDGANGGDGWYGGAKEKRAIDPASYYRFDRLWARCHELQPGAVLFSDAGPDLRWVGNERGVAGFTNWCRQNPAGLAPGGVKDIAYLTHGDPAGTVWRPAECDVSIRPGWFWHEQERPKTAEQLFGLWQASVGHGSALLLNLTPDRRGLIPEQDVAELAGFRRLVEGFTATDRAAGRPVITDAPGRGDAAALTRGGGWWAAAEGATTATIEIQLEAEQAVTGIRIEEEIRCGQRVEAFAVEAEYGNAWTELARGTTIGPQRILRLPPFVSRRLRVRILAAQAAPVLRRIKVY
ncbi:MAG: alpha-L-fucosidase [Planctomycetes bacterium]|nr:alpha-L-fucosidase [Planctomycetota bacterium]